MYRRYLTVQDIRAIKKERNSGSVVWRFAPIRDGRQRMTLSSPRSQQSVRLMMVHASKTFCHPETSPLTDMGDRLVGDQVCGGIVKRRKVRGSSVIWLEKDDDG